MSCYVKRPSPREGLPTGAAGGHPFCPVARWPLHLVVAAYNTLDNHRTSTRQLPESDFFHLQYHCLSQ